MAVDRAILGHGELQRYAHQEKRTREQLGEAESRSPLPGMKHNHGRQTDESMLVIMTQQVCLSNLELSPETGEQISNDNNFDQEN